MMVANIAGATRRLGKSQGYLELPVRDEIRDGRYVTIVTAWTPTPDELAALNKGASVHVVIYGSGQPPMKVEVGPEPEGIPDGK